MSLEDMMGALLEDEEVPVTLRFGTTRIEATPSRPLREPLTSPRRDN